MRAAWEVRLVIRRLNGDGKEWNQERWFRHIADSEWRDQIQRMKKAGDLSKTFKVVSCNRSGRTTPVLASAAAAVAADTVDPAARRVAATTPTWGLERRPVSNIYVDAPSYRR